MIDVAIKLQRPNDGKQLGPAVDKKRIQEAATPQAVATSSAPGNPLQLRDLSASNSAEPGVANMLLQA